ncbi:hydrogenase maturation protease [Lentiprolixibacter aurantiacus]|uniref:Hydrogenase maturation protease n=1 Tax=Lentiprolixibacter aurantiacus TaxID=2993939 RepID=A0AAE3SP13_9FLAO|nr:hydrogenase maturation protease [Lentiprolixibacter aurantiacus]MCX2720357.1 hydrogenase maturation protease [Lentiprolixibacter aurantiacus]
MKGSGSDILIIGIGNSGRADDGLGWAFVDRIRESLPDRVDYAYNYQLQIEDAELISHYSRVYFVDAHIMEWDEGFTLDPCTPKANQGFTTHELEPGAVLYLAETLYHKKPEAFILGITGLNFELKTGLSEGAEQNLARALNYFNENVLNLIT